MNIDRIATTIFGMLLVILCIDPSVHHVRGSADRNRPAPYALIIGVAEYEHWPSVSYALDNARKMARFLESGGFEVHLMENPSATMMKTALETLVYPVGRQAGRDILLYYCGQGISWSPSGEARRGWIAARNCPQPDKQPNQFEHLAISIRDLETYAGQLKSRRVIMLLDAALDCGMLTVKTPALRISGARSTRPIRQYIIAAKPDEPLAEYNLFAETLIQALSGQADAVQDGKVTGSELAVYMTNQISRATHGLVNPQYATSPAPESSHGDFVFDTIERPVASRLFVQCQPDAARIRIMNIKPKFTQGISLKPGKYLIEVTAAGHAAQTRWITVVSGQDKTLRIDLEKITPIKINRMHMAMRWIDPGGFFMGSPDDEPGRQTDEPLHWVRLTDGYRIQTTEVTVGQFRKFVNTTGYLTEAEKNGGCWAPDAAGRWQLRNDANWKTAGPWMNGNGQAREQLPVTCVSWNDAKAFARWLSEREGQTYDLPTEAQWEMACRAGTRSPFASGLCLNPQSANFGAAGSYYAECDLPSGNGTPQPKPVDTGKGNGWNLSGMHGNAAEWCRDWYGPYKESGGSGTAYGSQRVIRGGHFSSPADQCRCARRSSFKPGAAASVIGFRLVQSSAKP